MSMPISSPVNPDRLLVACQKGNLQDVQRLIEEGIDPNHSNMIRQSALHVAAWWARQDCLEYLLQKGANIHAQNTMTGATPLHCSMQSSKAALQKSTRLGSLRVLLEHGADPKALDASSRIPLEYLDENDLDRDEIVALFHEFIKPQPKMFKAIAERDMVMFKDRLQDEGALSLKYQDQTPLLQLVSDWCGNDDNDPSDDPFFRPAIDTLLDLGVGEHLSATTPKNETAMDLLCQAIVQRYKQLRCHDDLGKNWCEVVNRLVALFPETNTLYSESTTLLWMDIARRNLLDLAHQFQQWKISSHTINRQGMTPLQFAARSGHLEMLSFVAHNSSIKHQDARGETALQAAKANGHEQVVQWLEDYESKIQG